MCKRNHTLLFVAYALSILVGVQTINAQTTWYVDDDAPNDPGPGDPTVSDPNEDGSAGHPFDAIQEGIDAADPNDSVLVLDGTYTGTGSKDLDYAGKAITVRSENGPEDCIIDCQGDGRGFYFHSGETADAVVDGFTITNGHVDDVARGGAVCCESSDPTITQCMMTSCSAPLGGGVGCDGSSPRVEGCSIQGCTTGVPGYGGGIYCGSASDAAITDCMITGNSAYRAGGVYCRESSPTITGCVIAGNSAFRNGGGIWCVDQADPLIANCTISDNSAGDVGGGGIFCGPPNAPIVECNPEIINCEITGNTAANDGGGVNCQYGGSPTITRCAITANTADCGGGVSCLQFGSPVITDCSITANSALMGYYGKGGGVYCGLYSYPTITGCWITENMAAFEGGGVRFYECPYYEDYEEPKISNCLIAGNRAGSGRAGVACERSSPIFTNCTVTGNHGTGVYCLHDPYLYEYHPTMTNCVLWGNTGPGLYAVDSDPSVTYCDVQGGWAGEGNIDAEPILAFADDGHLMPGSPCIDAGTNDPPGGLPPTDLEGTPRPLDGDGNPPAIADMGAYEFAPSAPCIAASPPVLEFYVPPIEPDSTDQLLLIRNSGEGTLDWEIATVCPWLEVDPTSGSSTGETDEVLVTVDVEGLACGTYAGELTVTDPQAVNSPRTLPVILHLPDVLHVPSEYPTIQAAIDAAQYRDIVLVADGTYTAEGNKDLDFGGKVITVRSENGPESCIIDCEGDGRGFYFHSYESLEAVVDGFTITNGSATVGAGMYCEYSSPTIANCTITGNTAGYGGAGIYCEYGSPTVTNCMIMGNAVAGSGGGICCYDSSPTVTACTITGNVAEEGAGLLADGCDVVVINSEIAGNTATWDGGAILFTYHGSLMICNSVITGNSASWGGGFGCGGDGVMTVCNCTITANTASEEGGGIRNWGADLLIADSVLWGDTPQELYGSGGAVAVAYCDVEGGWAGDGNIDADPAFVDADGPDNDPNTWDDNDYRLATGSPCIDAGDNTAVPADIVDLDEDQDTDERTPLDLDGNPRFVQDPFTPDTGVPDPPLYRFVVDLGAYEYQFCYGDLDDDDDVDLADLAQLLGSYGETSGMTYYDGDVDGDGDVDLADLAELLGVYGTTCE